MGQLKRSFLLLCLVTCYLQAEGADKFTDENRPYEFGFSIDGEQHRHEKKDKNGIIMGEFGFITADGVYHITVYATDEQGRFKILSMKNIRVKPYPGTSSATATAKATGVKKGHSLSFPPSQNVVSTTEGQKIEKVNIFSPAKSCSHCSLPTTTSRPIQPANTAYEMYTNTNNEEVENKSNLYASSVFQGPNSHESVEWEINQREKSIQIDSDLGSIKNNNNQNSVPIDQEPQKSNNQNKQGFGQVNPNQEPLEPPRYNQNEQGFGQTNSNQKSSEPETYNQNEQGFGQVTTQQESGDYININGNNQQTTHFENNNPQIPNTNNNDRERLENNQNSLQKSSYANKLQNINDAQNYQQGPAALQNDYNDTPNDNSETLSSKTYNINREQVDADKNSFLRTELRNKPQGINVSPTYQNYDKQNTGQFNDNTDIQNQNSKTESLNLPTFNNRGSQKQTGIIAGERNPKQFGSFGQIQSGELQKPMLVAAQMQIVDKNTDIHYKRPGEEEGLPNGITKGDMEHLLYTFNYTVGFHGHFEEGYTSGSKQGYYFVTGRNGVRTRIDYTADETGFHPKISQEVLDLLSDEVPKPETERDDKYGLKGYEFKWLYYPIGTKR